MKNGKKIPGQQRGHKPWGDNPAKDATDQPIGLPGPLSDAPVWRVETAGSEAAQPMEDDSQRRVSSHRLSRSAESGLLISHVRDYLRASPSFARFRSRRLFAQPG